MPVSQTQTFAVRGPDQHIPISAFAHKSHKSHGYDVDGCDWHLCTRWNLGSMLEEESWFLTIQIYDNEQSPEEGIVSTGVDNKFIYSAQERATAFQGTVKTLLEYHPE